MGAKMENEVKKGFKPIIDSLVEFFEDKPEEFFISHEDLNKRAGVNCVKTGAVIVSLRNKLLTSQKKYLENVRGEGYRICKTENNIDYVNAGLKQSGKRLAKSLKICKNTKYENLSTVQKNEIIRKGASISALKQVTSKCLKGNQLEYREKSPEIELKVDLR